MLHLHLMTFNTQEKRKTRAMMKKSGKKSFKGSSNFIDEDFLAEENMISADDTIDLAKVRY